MRYLPRLLAYEENEDRNQQRIDGDRFRERRADDQGGTNATLGLGVAAYRLHRASHRETDTQTRAERSYTDRDSCRKAVRLRDTPTARTLLQRGSSLRRRYNVRRYAYQ